MAQTPAVDLRSKIQALLVASSEVQQSLKAQTDFINNLQVNKTKLQEELASLATQKQSAEVALKAQKESMKEESEAHRVRIDKMDKQTQVLLASASRINEESEKRKSELDKREADHAGKVKALADRKKELENKAGILVSKISDILA